MKKLFIILFAAVALSANAQNISFQLVTGLGGAFTFGEMPAYGISAAVEPKIFINSNISAGLRFEGDVLIGGNIDTDNPTELTVGMSSRTAQLIKAEYYFTDMKARPYAGFGIGRFTQANIGTSSAGDVSLQAVNGFGVAPEVGIALGGFRISAIYNIVPGKELVEIELGDTREVAKNYLVIQMSWKMFNINF